MDTSLREIIADLKSYLEYLKGLGINEWPLSGKRDEKIYRSEGSTGAGMIRESSISQSEGFNLKEIRSELGDCRRCKLHRGRRTLVFGEGNENAELMLIGEGPGYDEDIQGRPFVGRAGQLLTKILQSIGVQREEAYIANIIKCRPPQNRNPEPDEIRSCHPFLLKQIQAIRPRIICALGTFAAQTLLRTDSRITALRGKVCDFSGAGFSGIRIIPTYHPAYLLRNPEKKREVWEDMKQIAQILSGEF
jgi:uracil-DNA glycosylase family 4